MPRESGEAWVSIAPMTPRGQRGGIGRVAAQRDPSAIICATPRRRSAARACSRCGSSDGIRLGPEREELPVRRHGRRPIVHALEELPAPEEGADVQRPRRIRLPHRRDRFGSSTRVRRERRARIAERLVHLRARDPSRQADGRVVARIESADGKVFARRAAFAVSRASSASSASSSAWFSCGPRHFRSSASVRASCVARYATYSAGIAWRR